MSLDKLLVIGAGPIGLAMAKALKAHCVAYDQVDANDGIGGNWRRGVLRTTHIVSSKRTTAFADYPMPDDYPDFPSAAQMLAYLENYARDHELLDAIDCRRTVVRIEQSPGERWCVTFQDGEQRTYKGVVVCNGHHWDRHMPDYPGTFSGTLIHSMDYCEPSQLAGKRVLVIGAGNSACDVACEAARVGTSCDWSLRSGYWFLPKTAFGRPLTDLPIWGLPIFAQRLLLRAIVRIMIGDYRSYGLQRPTHKLFERHPTFGTDVLGYVRQGLVKPRPEIDRFDDHTVHFKDGSSAIYDMIVAATGFRNSFPFLPPGLVEVKSDTAQIYSGAFPAGARNLYIVGSSQPRNGFGSIVTPATDLFARMIRMQDELPQPIGDILKWIGERPPATNLLDPASARREIWFSKHALFMLKIYSWIMTRAANRGSRPPVHACDKPLAQSLEADRICVDESHDPQSSEPGPLKSATGGRR